MNEKGAIQVALGMKKEWEIQMNTVGVLPPGVKKSAEFVGGYSRRPSLEELTQQTRKPSNRRKGSQLCTRRRTLLSRRSPAANKHIWFDDEEINDTEDTAISATYVTQTATSYLSPPNDLNSVSSVSSFDNDFDGDDEHSIGGGDEDKSELRSEGASLYRQMKDSLDSNQCRAFFSEKLKESASALACAIYIHTVLFPAIEAASSVNLQGTDKDKLTNTTMSLVRAFERFHDDYIAIEPSNANSLYRTPETRSALDDTRQLLEESMTLPFHAMGAERGWHIISALTKPKVRSMLEHLIEELIYYCSAVKRLKWEWSPVQKSKYKTYITIPRKEYTESTRDKRNDSPVAQQVNVAIDDDVKHNVKLLSNKKQAHLSPKVIASCYSDNSLTNLKRPQNHPISPQKVKDTPEFCDENHSLHAHATSLVKPDVIVPQEDAPNDTLKVVLIGSSGSGKSTIYSGLKGRRRYERTSSSISQGSSSSLKKKSIGVSKQTMTFSSINECDTTSPKDEMRRKFSVWDFKQGTNGNDDTNHGSHHATKSLFFSSNSLYILFWDLGANNEKTWRCGAYPKHATSNDQGNYSSSSDEGKYFSVDSNHIHADRELQNDIAENVLFWVDCIRQQGLVGTTILPVASFDDAFQQDEAERRCKVLRQLLLKHCESLRAKTPGDFPKLIFDETTNEDVLRINTTTIDGIERIQNVMSGIVANEKPCCGHLGMRIPFTSQIIQATLQKLKQEFKIVKIEHVLAEVNSQISDNIELSKLQDALVFLSEIGDVLYFGESGRKLSSGKNSILGDFVILCPTWLSAAVSCILRHDLQDELAELYGGISQKQQQRESFVSWWNDTSNCAAVTSDNCVKLWQSMTFMRDLGHNTGKKASTTFDLEVCDFLQSLLVNHHVLSPIVYNENHAQSYDTSSSDVDHQDTTVTSRFIPTRRQWERTLFLIPALFSSNMPQDVWTYRASDSWKIILSHSWLFQDAVPPGLLEQVFSSVLSNISNSNRFSLFPQHHPSSRTIRKSGASDTTHQHLRLHAVKCWKTAFLLEVEVCSEAEKRHTIRSAVKIFVHMNDKTSDQCVCSHGMSRAMRRLVVSAKGLAANTGAHIWMGGLDLVIRSADHVIQSTFGGTARREIVCPYCLAEKSCKTACVWMKDSVRRKLDDGVTTDWCRDGHNVDLRLLFGKVVNTKLTNNVLMERNPFKRIDHLLGSVVLVGLWDHETKSIKRLGSGFIADNKRKLVVTAAHTLIDTKTADNFGKDYYGLEQGRAVIGVINKSSQFFSGGSSKGSKTSAIFRYYAEIVSKDPMNVDACVLRITGEIERDIRTEDRNTADLLRSFYETHIKFKDLSRLKIAKNCCGHDENIWILGYSQEENTLFSRPDITWNTHIESARGYVMRTITGMQPRSDRHCCQPQEEIAVVCPTATSGHSGGPCVDQDGRVVGILSRGDLIGDLRFLVPASQLELLLKKAKESLKCCSDKF